LYCILLSFRQKKVKFSFKMFSQVFLIAFSVLLPFVSGQLMVASVMYNPVGTPTQESHGEWIELRNAGTEPLDIRGYFFTNKDPAESREIPFVNKFAAIPPGGYVLAVRNESVFERNYPGYQADLVYNFDWANSGDWIEVYNQKCVPNERNNDLPDCVRERLTQSPNMQDCVAWSAPPEYREWDFDTPDGYVLRRSNYDFPQSWEKCSFTGWVQSPVDPVAGVGVPHAQPAPSTSPSPGPTPAASPSSSVIPSASPSVAASSSPVPVASASSSPVPAASASSSPVPAASASSSVAPAASTTSSPSLPPASSNSASKSIVLPASVTPSPSPIDPSFDAVTSDDPPNTIAYYIQENGIPWWLWLIIVVLVLLILYLLHLRRVEHVKQKMESHFVDDRFEEGGDTDIIAQAGYAHEIGPSGEFMDTNALDVETGPGVHMETSTISPGLETGPADVIVDGIAVDTSEGQSYDGYHSRDASISHTRTDSNGAPTTDFPGGIPSPIQEKNFFV
jgi:hypothetical protein